MNPFDIIASLIIAFCINSAFKKRWVWLLYAFGGFCISIYDFYLGPATYGQAILNFALGIIAIKNYIKFKN